jgi:nucleoid-associated protein
MKIKEFVIHWIDKAQREDSKVVLREQGLPGNDPRVIKFTERVIQDFEDNKDKPTSIYADFHADTVNHPFSIWCRDYFEGKIDLITFTTNGTNRLKEQMDNEPLSTGGYLVFANIEVDENSKLLIVMLHAQDGLTITKTLEFAEVTHLELKQIDKAALISAPKNGRYPEKPLTYAGFRKEMSRYFQIFLCPDAVRNASKDSRHLLQVIDTYTGANNFDEARIDQIRVNLREYAQDQSAHGEEIELGTVAAFVEPANQAAFITFANANQVSATIKPDNSVFRRWKVIRHKSNDGLSIQFKAEQVGPKGTDHRLLFDEAQRTLTITALEDAFIEKIKASKLGA